MPQPKWQAAKELPGRDRQASPDLGLPEHAGNDRYVKPRLGLVIDAAINMKRVTRSIRIGLRSRESPAAGAWRAAGRGFADIFKGGFYIIGCNFYHQNPTDGSGSTSGVTTSRREGLKMARKDSKQSS